MCVEIFAILINVIFAKIIFYICKKINSVKQKKLSFLYTEFSYNELPKSVKELFLAARKAALNAYAPYSKFMVGAAILLENGQIVTGNNQENSAYPSGLCAERVALFYANSQFPDVAIKTIVLIALKNKKEIETPVYPCGACRQVILESQSKQKKPIKLFFGSKNFVQGVSNAASLLPLEFDKNSLL